jgi:hypothetical protein
MKAIATYLSAAALAAALVTAAAPASAAVFASFSPDAAAMDFKWINNGSTNNMGTGGHFFSIAPLTQSAVTPQGVATHFQFLDPALTALGFIPATFTLDATVTSGHPASLNGAGVYTETNVDGHFSFVYSGATTANFNGSGIGLTHGENLLSGVFTDAWIQGAGGSGSFNLAAINGGALSMTSALETFHNLTPGTEEFAMNLLAATPIFGANTNKALKSFRANGGGNFSFSANVPEPQSWALMIVGFGGLGVIVRRRRAATAIA